MLLLQMPGAVLVVYFQGVVNHGDWTTWVPYVAQAIQQTILIALSIAFRCCCRAQKPNQVYALHDVYGDDEEHGIESRTDSTAAILETEDNKPFLSVNS